jgi:hypothetical protein
MKTTDFIAYTFFSLPKWFDFTYTGFPSMVNGIKIAQKNLGFNTKYNFMSLYQVIIPANN